MNNLLGQIAMQPVDRSGLVLPYTQYFASKFNNVTNDLFSGFGVGHTWALFTGTDSETGSAWYGESPTYPNGGTGPMDVILNGVMYLHEHVPGGLITPANYATYGNVQIVNEAGPTGANVNVLSLTAADAGLIDTGSDQAFDTQQWLCFQSVASTTNPLPNDLENLYWRYWMKKPAYINTMPTGSDIFFEVKTGGYNGLYGGDLRISGEIVKPASGSLYWRVTCDHGGNVDEATTLLPNGNPWPTAGTNSYLYWRAQNTAIPVAADTWTKIEVYLRRSRGRGCMMMAINDVSAMEYYGNTMGVYDNPIGRFSPFGIYSVKGTCSGKIWDLLIANYPENGSVLEQRVIDRFF